MMKELLELLGGAIVVVGFVLGLWQYRVAQKWKKAEFAANQLLKLSSLPELELCCRILDWQQRPFVIPERYRDYTGQAVLQHTEQELAQAMKPAVAYTEFTLQQALYRDLFDQFFTYLADINHFVSIGLISQNDVSSLKYWLGKIATAHYAGESIFKAFLDTYEYDGVQELMRRFGIHFNSAPPVPYSNMAAPGVSRG